MMPIMATFSDAGGRKTVVAAQHVLFARPAADEGSYLYLHSGVYPSVWVKEDIDEVEKKLDVPKIEALEGISDAKE